jgi:acetyl-CoA acetyltransferase
MERNPQVDWAALDDVLLGCANQAGEDNRNVARMAVLLSGLPQDARYHHQPLVRIGHECHRHRRPSHPQRRC